MACLVKLAVKKPVMFTVSVSVRFDNKEKAYDFIRTLPPSSEIGLTDSDEPALAKLNDIAGDLLRLNEEGKRIVEAGLLRACPTCGAKAEHWD